MIDHPVGQLHEIFEAQVARSPSAIAVEHGQQRLTYRQLDARANQLAHYLRAQGVGPDCLVGMCAERSLDLVVGILGVLKAGGAYVPLDPAYPVERLRVILEDADVALLLTNQKNLGTVQYRGRTVFLDSDWPEIARHSAEAPVPVGSPSNLAYVVYTSGSTGRPKGVLLEHRGVCYLARAQQRMLGLGVGTRVLQFFSLNFDGLVWELSMTWAAGATLVLADAAMLLPGPGLIRFLRENAINVVSMTPSALLVCPYQELPDLHTLITGGEALTAELVARWAPGRRFFNVYAPTECTIVAIVAQCHPGEGNPPLGRPFEHVPVYVLGDDLRPVPEGEPGELYIGGPGVARGYFDPELTAERFIDSPFPETAGTRLYKTGDRVKWLPDGNLDFLGRSDHQVKLRGFRIELGEVEAALRAHPMVGEAAVIVREDAPGDKRLVAYMLRNSQAAGGARLRPPELRAFLQERLPEHMVPAVFVELDTLPLSPNGKLDRGALPAPESAPARHVEPGDGLSTPQASVQALILEAWQTVLGRPRIGLDDNFAELGGDSLQVMRLAAHLSAVAERDITPKFVMLHPTVRAMSAAWPALQPGLLRPALTPAPIAIEPARFRLDALYATPGLVHVERRPLFALHSAGLLPRVDAAAIQYLPWYEVEYSGLDREQQRRDWCGDLPFLEDIITTPLGRIGVLYVPLYREDLFTRTDDLIRSTLQAMAMARNLGAELVALTGLMPSALNYGRALLPYLVDRPELPPFTTGHATTTACVVLMIERLLEEAGYHLAHHAVACVGLGSIGATSLRLMLSCLPHPHSLVLVDLHGKRADLDRLAHEVRNEYGFRGTVQVATTTGMVPDDVYSARVIVGATSMPDVVDVDRLQPGTVIIDDSGPHCFNPPAARRRFETVGDILFSEGGAVRTPWEVQETTYLPDHIARALPEHVLLQALRAKPRSLMGCLMSSLLSARLPAMPPTLGLVRTEISRMHYQGLRAIGMQGAHLYCEQYVLDPTRIAAFRARFGSP